MVGFVTACLAAVLLVSCGKSSKGSSAPTETAAQTTTATSPESTAASAVTDTVAPDTTAGASADTTVKPRATTETTGGADDGTKVSGSTVSAAANACPVEGCKIEIASAAKGPNGELSLDFTANFAPDVSKNHIHVYWDRYTAQQVSNDAEPKYKVKQGDWIPTDVTKGFITEGAVSVKGREQSHTVCVTAGDRDHNVLDPSVTNCRDVSSLL